jgi:hypothetical protein
MYVSAQTALKDWLLFSLPIHKKEYLVGEEEQKLEVQQVLDDLLKEELIPFALTAYSVNTNDRGEYVIHFNDSRIHSCRFFWAKGEHFKDVVRGAVLERVNRMSGPLSWKSRKATS